jgi:transposase
MKVTAIGIDLAKNVFQVHGVDEHGKVVLRKQSAEESVHSVFRSANSVPGGNGSLWWRA